MTEQTSLESRLVEMEIQLMHLQHDYDHVNAECLRQQTLIKHQQARIEALEQVLRGWMERKGPASDGAET